MLDNLTSEVWGYLIVGLIVVAVFYAWAADAILGIFGFGVVLTAIIAAVGGYGGLLATDWAVRHHQLPYGYETPPVYFAGAMVTVTLLLLVLCILKRLIWR